MYYGRESPPIAVVIEATTTAAEGKKEKPAR
jgi:hypothetical protein